MVTHSNILHINETIIIDTNILLLYNKNSSAIALETLALLCVGGNIKTEDEKSLF